MDKIVFCNALAFVAIPALWSTAFASTGLVDAPLQSAAISWSFLAFVGIAVIGAIAAIIWEMKSD